MHSQKLVLGALLSALCIGISLAGPQTPQPPQPLKKIAFNQDIRPLLSDNCFACHGPDKNKRQANLRLDQPNRAVVPGDILASGLFQRISAPDGDPRQMPPAEYHKKLTTAQKQLLARWIGEGANYQKHWAYELPIKASLPAGVNGVDFLVRNRLKEVGLTPSPTADRHTLIRRLSFDLLGLPPTQAEVDAFVKDTSPNAYGKLVERLLASPHYGERMAQGWLDVVRFADTIGYHSDTPRNIWPYRDWVIAAFNNNKRFDRFTKEQLAGDLLPDANQDTRIGSAYNRLLLTTEEGGAQPKDYEARYMTDRVRAVGTVWLGQTTGCAQCHDHKFDPISTRDFYALGAFFADVDEAIIGAREPGMLVTNADQAKELTRLNTQIGDLQKRYNAPHPELASSQEAWEKNVREAMALEGLWTALKPTKAEALGGTQLRVQADNSLLATGENPGKNSYTLEYAPATAGSVQGLRLEVFPDKSLPEGGPGRAGNGNFVLSEVVAQVRSANGAIRSLRFTEAQASFEQSKQYSAAATIDGDVKGDTEGWAILPEAGKPQVLILTLAEPLSLANGETLQVTLKQNYGDGHSIGKFRLSATNNATALRPLLKASAEIVAIVKMAPEQRTAEQNEKLSAYYKTIAPELAELRTELSTTQKAKETFENTVPRCLVTNRNATPRTVRVLPRGDFLNESGEVVKAATPAFLPRPTGGTRLDLANWLVSRQNPLTARTVMNRLWKQFFGTGLSKVVEDLGAQGEPPTNPALLDWLACEFMDSGWDMKHMVRIIVNSATYKQVSTVSKTLLARDPYNREYARQSRYRLEAEEVRDNALQIAGLLTLKEIGGPSVKPYQPDRYWENLNFPVRDYMADKGESQYRRGLYVWWQRSFLHPSLLAFDAPTREECVAERNRSNIPQQALVLLNDPTYVEAARAFGRRILTEASGQPEQRITWAWKQALQRTPDVIEIQTLQRVYEQQKATYVADAAAAAGLLAVGNASVPETMDKAELAAWTHVARIILNLHETITRP